MSLEGAIAAHRFGLGARAGEIAAANRAPREWLMGQLDGPTDQPQSLTDQPLQSGSDLVAAMVEYQKQRKALR
ncbi:MAG: hypothetical protein KGI68_13555, partial [Alphaproteobacteria bacterium]|nr:hypothetical protein [Alphaproteobacteria bacterium]